MNISFVRLFAKAGIAFVLLFFAMNLGYAAPPTLTPIPGDNFPNEVQPGHTYTFNLQYTQAQGDPPKSLSMILETPGGEVTERATPPAGDPTHGVPVTWTYAPENAGNYKFHFEATSSTGDATRYPASVSDDPQFVSVSIVTKWVIFLVGLLIALVFLPFVIYVGARAANKRGNPSAVARVALLIGILASFGLFLYLFYTIYSPLLLILVGVGALAALIALSARR